MNLHCFYIPRVPLPLPRGDAYNGCCHTFLRKNHQSMYRYDPDDRILCFVPFPMDSVQFPSWFRHWRTRRELCFKKHSILPKLPKRDKREHYPYAGRADPLPSLLRYEPFINNLASLKRLFARQRPLAVKWHGSGTKKPEYIWMRLRNEWSNHSYYHKDVTASFNFRGCGHPRKGLYPLTLWRHDRVVENGTIGEIRVTGQGLMLGYLNRPKETAERLRNGYLYTGDLGYKNPDGSLVVCGRKQNS